MTKKGGSNVSKQKEFSLAQIAEALFIINRHAKTAPEPKSLYDLKKKTITKLLKENHAEKIGLHFSNHPKYSQQHSTLLVKVDNYFFHIPPTKEDFQNLDHLGDLDADYRNPKAKMGLSKAKHIIKDYLGIKESEKKRNSLHRTRSSYYTPSSLGQMDWSPKKRNKKNNT